MIRLAKPEDKERYYTMLSYCFNMGNASIENNVNKDYFPMDEIIVNEVNGEISSSVHVVPFMMHFDHKTYPMGGIAGVSSFPESRDHGGIKEILTYSLQYMKEKGMIFSALGPFSFEFYSKYGWEWGFVFQKLKLPIQDLAKTKKAHHYQSLSKKDDEIVNLFRKQYACKFNGSIDFSLSIRENRWQNFYQNFTHCYAAYDDSNQIEAIAFFRIENRILICDELYFLSETGRQHMLHLFYTHRSQVDQVELLLPKDDNIRATLPNPRIQYWEWANMMFRVVCVKEALQAMQLKENNKGKLRLKVHDAQADWNNQIFELIIENNHLIVTELKKQSSYDFEMDIQRLSQLILGFIDGKEALQLELVTCKNVRKEPLFNKIFQKRPTMLWHMF